MFASVVMGLAAASAVTAAGDFPSRTKFTFGSGGPSAPTNSGFKRTSTTSTSTATCTAKALTYNFSYSKDAHVNAVAEAFNYACSNQLDDPYWYPDVVERVRDASKHTDNGAAFAKAIAVASTDCTSSGNAYGCAGAYAKSGAWADAVATVHAQAWAEAINKCECDGKWVEAATGADVLAEEVAKLEAEVVAIAESYVCVDPDYKEAWDTAVQTCIQDIYATLLGKAVAVAVIDGRCTEHLPIGDASKSFGDISSDARASVVAQIKVDELAGCVDYFSLYNPYH